MAVTMQQVLAELDKDEPDYTVLAALGPDALPHLQQIVDADDPLRAAKAAYAASLVTGPGSLDVLRTAAAHRDPQVRVAAAHALGNLAGLAPETLGAAEAAPSDLLGQLLEDGDPGVRKVALRSAGTLGDAGLRDKVAAIASDDPHEFLRSAAATTAQTLG